MTIKIDIYKDEFDIVTLFQTVPPFSVFVIIDSFELKSFPTAMIISLSIEKISS